MKASAKRSVPATSIKTPKQDLAKDDSKSGKAVGRTLGTSSGDKDIPSHLSEGRLGHVTNVSSAATSNGNSVSASARGSTSSARTSDSHGGELKVDSGAAKSAVKDDATEVTDGHKPTSRLVHSPRHDSSFVSSKSSDKLPKRTSPAEDPDRLSKRRKGDIELRDSEGEVRISDKERSIDARLVDLDKIGTDEQNMHRSTDKLMDRSKDKGNERYDRDYRERSERPDKSRGDDVLVEKSRDRSMERYGREHSVERGAGERC